ncbi:glycosyltransferase [Dissulfurirhabdus thermomarina]|uniref:Glycosyltransferase n=1 Tax=Dissulfurirhabdus thermomarina TaxID=1765737 RepID=A0A6N9TNB0_DISTH|nr:glycosyltransferase [Dissulfurirhabdus thermomarina]NDY42629.1 glycosyltransferase [Dissulfurirhabdus thermomarina]NMX23068.1 glycosyltransferase [Dissulfurirhabdus thermomarina]
MADILEQYAEVAGADVVRHLRQLAEPLKGAKVVHVNSTREGGGVAEILRKLVPLMQALELDTTWEVVTGEAEYYQCTKGFHNALQGFPVGISQAMLAAYEATNAQNAERLRPVLEEADFVFIHDPQPAPLLHFCPGRKGKWLWRCHIDVSRPYRAVWKYLRNWVQAYDASIFSLAAFAQRLPHPQYLIAPSIDPLSEKNMDLPPEEIDEVRRRFELNPDLPLVLQVSRFDRFKDPLGVIEAYRIVKRMTPLQLVLAGGGAADDPEGAVVLEEVRRAAADDPHIRVLLLPPDAHRTINALQRAADIVFQKSTKEGFGLTVAEAMWKGKPVIGGDTGGIRLQVIDHYTGFRVRTPEGAALRTRYLLHRRDEMEAMGARARRHVRENFLVTRHLREYLALMVSIQRGLEDRIEVGA